MAKRRLLLAGALAPLKRKFYHKRPENQLPRDQGLKRQYSLVALGFNFSPWLLATTLSMFGDDFPRIVDSIAAGINSGTSGRLYNRQLAIICNDLATGINLRQDIPRSTPGDPEMLTPFHLAFQVRDIDEARDFYGVKMGLPEGRSDASWIDFNMFGHQVVTHLNPALGPTGKVANHCNPVDDHAVPVPHFGVVLEVETWKQLAERVRTFIGDFIIEPYVRFEGQPGEQYTMFFEDPSGNALEFKAFADIESQLFATTREAQA